MTVTIASNTVIQKTAAGTLSDLQTGQFITVMGAADASGNVAATAISVRPSGPSPRASATGGGTPGASSRPSRPTNGSGPQPGNGGTGNGPGGAQGGGVFGTISKVDGSTLTVDTAQGKSVMVTVGSNTAITRTVTGATSDLQVGQSLSVTGPGIPAAMFRRSRFQSVPRHSRLLQPEPDNTIS